MQTLSEVWRTQCFLGEKMNTKNYSYCGALVNVIMSCKSMLIEENSQWE